MSFRELLDMDYEAVKKDLEALRRASEELASASVAEIEAQEKIEKTPRQYNGIRVPHDLYMRIRYLSTLLNCKIGTLLGKAVAEFILHHYEELVAQQEERKKLLNP